MSRSDAHQPKRSTAILVSGLGVLLIVLSGCGGLSTRYHDHPGNRACLKVYPFWENTEGERHLVGGLDCRLYPRGESSSDSKMIETTDTDRPLLFDDLDPGAYRFKVYLDDRLLLSEVLDLLSGKRLTARIDVRGARRADQFKQTVDRIGTGISNALVSVGENLIVILIDGLEMSLEEAIDDDDDERDKDPVPRQKKTNAFGRPVKK